MSDATNERQQEEPPEPGMVLIYCRYIRRNGKKIFPKKSKYFRFWVKPRGDA